jgi:hypothetical protein
VRPEVGRRAFQITVAVCAVLALADPFVPRHPHWSWESWFAFYGIYGYVGCFGLVLAARLLRRVVMRDEDYWRDR